MVLPLTLQVLSSPAQHQQGSLGSLGRRGSSGGAVYTGERCRALPGDHTAVLSRLQLSVLRGRLAAWLTWMAPSSRLQLLAAPGLALNPLTPASPQLEPRDVRLQQGCGSDV